MVAVHLQTSFDVCLIGELCLLRAHACRSGELADVLARQAVHAAAGGGFEVARAALDELLWRFDRAHRGDAWVTSLDPLEASCGCDDFLRSSLGACVHVMWALQNRDAPRRAETTWDPIRPLGGAEPWTARVRGNGEPVAPAVRALRRRDARLRIPRVVDVDAQLATLRTPLYDYQRAGVERFFRTGRLLLADDMGLGKTAQAIAIAHVLFGLALISNVLVIVPAPLKGQWTREWARFSDRPAEIISYEQARRQELTGIDFAILDEAQRIKNATTLTARMLKRLQPRWRLALTGTPLENRLEELASITSWVDDLAIEPAWRLRAWHTIRSESNRVIGVRGLETIRARLAPYMLRRLRRDVLEQLPPRRDTQVPVLMTSRQREAHDALQLAIARVLGANKRGPEVASQLQCLLAEQRLICNGIALAQFRDYWPAMPRELAALHSPKLGVLREMLASLVVEQARKVIVFSQWRRMLQLAEHTSADVLGGIASVYFTGNESPRRRADSLARFHDDPNVRVLWSTDAGALGLNLQRAASCCINLELPWNPAVLEQRIARIYRLGQTAPVDVYHLVTIDGIEGRIANLLETKQSLFDGLFETHATEIRFDPAPAPNALVLALANPRQPALQARS